MRGSIPGVDGDRAVVLLPDKVQFLGELLDAPLSQGIFGDTAGVTVSYLTYGEVLRYRCVPVKPVHLHCQTASTHS